MVVVVNGGAFGDLNAVLINVDFDTYIDLDCRAESAGLRRHGGEVRRNSERRLIE